MQAQFNKPPERDPLNVEENVAAGRIFSKTERERFLARTIISFSGWRRVFAADKDEESRTAEISPLSALFTAAAAAAAARRLKKRLGREPVTIAVAMDTRPTGSGIAFNVIRALLAERARVHWLSVAPTPEALSYTAGTEEVDGLIYVTASHNPVGHNGLKFAAADGGVIAPGENERLKGEFLNIFNSQEQLEELRQRILAASSGEIEAVYSQVERHKSSALRLYREFTSRVFTAHDQALEASSLLEKLRQRILERPIGLVAEFNGSARTCSIDVDFFRSLGVRLKVINGQPGRIKHAILPEGEALLPCCRALEKAASRDPSFELGYVPDCDGDRGNVVLLDQTGRAHPLQAQEVFALAVVSELSFLASFADLQGKGSGLPRLAVVVNGPTSGRIDRIASAFGALVFRAEVGEANVVELARQKRAEGYLVRILGEGSNGGNITHPSKVRDPLNTVLAFIKMARLEGVAEQWLSRCDKKIESSVSRLARIVDTLPRYYSTGLYEKRSLLQIKSKDHNKLKMRYEEIFAGRWPQVQPELFRRMGVTGYRIINYEGTRTVQGPGGREGAGKEGGFKVIFTDRSRREVGFLWMRGSKTEPVFRIMADVSTLEADEKYLLQLHSDMLYEADRAAD